MKKTCFRNGCAVIGDSLVQTDVLVQDGIICAVGDWRTFQDCDDIDFIDCSGKILMPGAIDAHCHIQLDTGIFATSDDWAIGTAEAARGGITTVIDFVGPQPGENLKHALDARLEQARDAIVDYTFHMTALDASEKTLSAIDQCRQWHISSLKIYTTYRPNYYLDDASILSILERAARANLTVLVHCENDAIVTAETARHQDEDILRAYPDMRPPIAEVEAAERVIRLAEYADASVVIAHNSCAETTRCVTAARARGVRVFNETAPQYLFLNAMDNKESSEPWRYILQPPLRSAQNNIDLQSAVLFGAVDMLITDHCAYTRTQKQGMNGGIPGGLPGLETLLPLCAAIPSMTWPKLARLLAANPARIYGLWPHKGAIAPGFDADIVILRDETFTIDENQLHTFARYSPFHGHHARGIVETVYRRGECILRHSEIVAPKGSGKFVTL